MDDNYDPAFGPVSGIGTPPTLPTAPKDTPELEDPVFTEMQQLLNRLGYGPLEVNGLWRTDTINAVKRFLAAIGKKWDADGGEPLPRADLMDWLRAEVNKTAPATVGPATNPAVTVSAASAATATPFWKRPNFLWGAAAVAAVVGYVAYRSGALKGRSLAGLLGDEKSEPKVKPGSVSRRIRAVSKRAKCDRLPDIDEDTFASLEDVEAESEAEGEVLPKLAESLDA